MKNYTAIYSDILESIKTVGQADQLVSEIDVLLDSIFETKTNFGKAFKSISVKTASILKENLDVTNKEALTDFLNRLRNKVKNLKTIKLYLAFSPSQHTIDNIFKWVFDNMGNSIILDVEEDATILGGAIIVFDGKYRDFSLKKNLNEVFAKKREQIIHALNS